MRAARHRDPLLRISYPTSHIIRTCSDPTGWRVRTARNGLRVGERKPSMFLHVEAIETYAGLNITSLESWEPSYELL